MCALFAGLEHCWPGSKHARNKAALDCARMKLLCQGFGYDGTEESHSESSKDCDRINLLCQGLWYDNTEESQSKSSKDDHAIRTIQTGKITPNMQISKHSNCIYSAVSSLHCLEVNNLLWSKSYISVSGVPMCQRRPFAAVNIKICVETSCICHRTIIPLYASMNAGLGWHTVHQSC